MRPLCGQKTLESRKSGSGETGPGPQRDHRPGPPAAWVKVAGVELGMQDWNLDMFCGDGQHDLEQEGKREARDGFKVLSLLSYKRQMGEVGQGQDSCEAWSQAGDVYLGAVGQ